MTAADDTVQYYRARAGEYDESAGFFEPGLEHRRAGIKARFADAFRGRAVLEIACGTGFWTAAIAGSARSVLAVDINDTMLVSARARLQHIAHVTFQEADAYSLEGVPGGFTAAFSVWWWSHMPRRRWSRFVTRLHAKLMPGAIVLMADQLPTAYEPRNRRREGDDYLEDRLLRDGRVFRIIKNFPTQEELVASVAGVAEQIEYREFPDLHMWELRYRVRPPTGLSPDGDRRNPQA